MARRSRRLPIASADAEPELSIGQSDWERIETAYGVQLPKAVRLRFGEATTEFLYWEVFERTAEPIAHSEKVIVACERGAREFQNALLSHAFQTDGGAVYATHLIKRNFQDARMKSNDLFHSLSGILTSFRSACIIARNSLKESVSFHEGVSWAAWVRRLTQIAKEEGLPWQVRKDAGGKSRNDRQSPFVLFLWELQESLPEECRRSRHSKSALADSISDARTSGLKRVLPTAE